MPSFPEFNPTFDNDRQFIKPPAEHPYWANNVFAMQEYGFSREYLVLLAELDQAQNGQLASRVQHAVSAIRSRCMPTDEVLTMGIEEAHSESSREQPLYEPQYVANALMRPLRDFWRGGNEQFNNAPTLMRHLIEAEEVDNCEFDMVLFQAYHPDNRMMMAFQPGVRTDGTIIDAEGSPSQHPQFVDERGQLFDLSFYSRQDQDL